jgi:predicted DNA-binding transcriptional regulator YafY
MKTPKVQRWLDLLAALLRHHYPVTFEQLIREVPAYAASGQKEETRRRMFERDKDELRAFGVPIETVPAGEGDPQGYRLRVRDFYLPYLAVRSEGSPKPRKVDPYGYRSLPSLSFEPEELAAVAAAAARVRELGDPLLAEHAESAMRKLACDLPVDAAGRQESDTQLVPPRAGARPDLLVLLDAAVRDRKLVTFTYRSIGSGAAGPRTVEPFGLFFLDQHWYLAGRTPGEATVKNYRLSRIEGAAPNPARPGTPDYEMPPGFDLREHARSRQAWELGAGDAVLATVEFRSRAGAAAAARRLGEEMPGSPDRRQFRARRLDVFARWLLSFGDDLLPVAPGELIEEYRGLVRETLAHHRSPPDDGARNRA